MKTLKISLLIILGIIILLALTLRIRYGGGGTYPDLSGEPLIPASEIEIAVTSEEPIGNVAVSPEGRIFFTIHPESRPEKNKLMEWKNGAVLPYPDEAFQDALITPLGLVVDGQNRLWVIDHGMHGFRGARLLVIDLNSSRIFHEHPFSSDAAPGGSFLQDIRVDSAGQTVYIADVSFIRKDPAIVVYDLKSGSSRRVLDDHPSVSPQDWIIQTPIKDMVFLAGLVALKPGIDGIALDKNDEWLYYGAMAHDGLFRIQTKYLKDASLSPAQIAGKVELFSIKPLSDGLAVDAEGNVYITDVEHGAVFVVGQDRRLKTLVKSGQIRWSDDLSIGPEGWIYLADSAIPHQILQTKAHMREFAPYYIFRFRF